MTARALVASLALAACSDAPPPLADCGGDLSGVWEVEGAPGQRWHAIAAFERAEAPKASGASGASESIKRDVAPERAAATWEWYALFDDRALGEPPPAGVVDAPGAIDLPRLPAGATTLVGGWLRRYERGADSCVITTPAVLTRCHGDRATLTVSPPRAPLDVAACTPAPPAPAVTWQLRRR